MSSSGAAAARPHTNSPERNAASLISSPSRPSFLSRSASSCRSRSSVPSPATKPSARLSSRPWVSCRLSSLERRRSAKNRLLNLLIERQRPSCRLVLLDRPHVERGDDLGDFLGDEARGDRRAIVVQDRDERGRVDAGVVDEQRLQL